MKGKPVPLILGHNQFIGVDHLSHARARERAGAFDEEKAILDLLRVAQDSGVEGLMVSTHHKLKSLLPAIRADAQLAKLAFYPIVPYAQGYVTRANQIGIPGLAKESLKEARAGGAIRSMLQGTRATLGRDPSHFIGPLVDMELRPFAGLRVDGVFLHNAITDLLVGWDSVHMLEAFQRHVERRYDARGGFCTFNFPLLMDRIEGSRVRRPLVLSSFNPVGFQMNPGRAESEALLASGSADVVAMSIFAAGMVRPDDAFAYLQVLPGLESVVFGASSASHVRQTAGKLAPRLVRARA